MTVWRKNSSNCAAERKADQEGGEGEIELAHQVAEHGEDQRHRHAEHAVLRAVGAGDAEQRDNRIKHRVRHVQHEGEQPQAHGADQQIEDVGERHGGEQAVDQRAVVLEDQRPRLHAMDQEGADQDGGREIAGHADGQQRNERRADDGVVGGFGRGHAFQLALAEIGGARRSALGRGIAEEAGDHGADAGQRADGNADQARAPDGARAVASNPSR